MRGEANPGIYSKMKVQRRGPMKGRRIFPQLLFGSAGILKFMMKAGKWRLPTGQILNVSRWIPTMRVYEFMSGRWKRGVDTWSWKARGLNLKRGSFGP